MKMVRSGLMAFVCFFLSFCARGQPLGGSSEQVSIFDTILTRLHTDVMNTSRSADVTRLAEQERAAQRSDGSWGDIDYANRDITAWRPQTHLKRIQDLALAYSTNGDPELYRGIVAGLQYWYKKDPKSNNWWHNDIKVPQTLGQILITLRFAPHDLPPALEDSLIRRMKRGDIWKMTGANKLDEAIHFLYRAVLTRDVKLMDTAVSQAFQPIAFTTAEGLQIDYSYLQHGPQLQVSSYGAVFLDGEYRVAKYLRGTRYALKDSCLSRLSNYYKNSYLRAIRGSYIDFSLEGRGISRPDILHKQGETGRLGEAQLIDPANAMAWYAAMARTSGAKPSSFMVQPEHTHFWRADYTLHVRPSYSFNVRVVSTRTRRTESGNRENLLGRYLPDGATDIQLRGDEYYNIMPVWEWDKIPGVTAAAHATDKPMDKFWGEPGSTDFAGGVSDSLYGASAYALDYDGVTAKKSWFFFDKEVVCLGAGINSRGNEAITTTVNQCWLHGKAVIHSATSVSSSGASSSAPFPAASAALTVRKDIEARPQWVIHDDVGYYFPEGGQIRLTTKTQKGDWYRINNSFSRSEVSGKVFKLWLDHGVQPADAGYAYVVVPGIADAGDAHRYPAAALRILANTDTLQAVRQRQLDMVQAVFYKGGTVGDSAAVGSSGAGDEAFWLSADQPCIVLIKHLVDGRPVLSVADPTQKIARVMIVLHRGGRMYSQVVELPRGEYAGSTVRVTFTAADPPAASLATRPGEADTGSIDAHANSIDAHVAAAAFIQDNFAFAVTQLKSMLAKVPLSDSLFPRTRDSSGRLICTGMHDWTGGFFPGELWYAYEYTHDPTLKTAAAAWTEKLAPMQYFTGHHDLGFLLDCSYGNGYRLTRDTGYAAVLIHAAQSLATRFDPVVGCIKSWNSFTSWHGGPPYRYPVIIDNMMNLELLFTASRLSGDTLYRHIAIRHAEQTLKNQVRPDYSCYHVVCYDPATGRVLARETAQGYADNSAWSRGQAWGIYGFTVVYRETHDPKFLVTARKMADFFLNNERLPADKVPYWDFNVNEPGFFPGVHSKACPGQAPLLRDASAAAVVASALFELSTYLGQDRRPYYEAAVAILHSLASPSYRTAPGTNDPFILQHSVGSVAHGFEIDVPLIYADYYFLEALHRYATIAYPGQ